MTFQLFLFINGVKVRDKVHYFQVVYFGEIRFIFFETIANIMGNSRKYFGLS